MSRQTILNGTFDNDPSAEKIRLAFDKVNANFSEQYTSLPQLDPANLAGNAGKIIVVNAGGTAFELVPLAGGGDMLSTNNLNDVNDAAQARLNLGLGSAAQGATSDFATAAQGATADTALQSIVAGTDIGIDVTDPINPIVNFTGTAVGVTSLTFDPPTGILTIGLTGGGTVTEDLSDYTVLKIDGLTVEKGGGNTNFNAIEVNDRVNGWLSNTRYIAGIVNSLPHTTEGNITFALDGET